MNAAVGTAASVASAKTLSLKVLFGIIGAAQIATIAATPIPAFAEGGTMDEDGLMLINDHPSGRQEYVERDGKIYTTSQKDAIVKGKKGDTIYKDYDTMVDKFIMSKAINSTFVPQPTKIDISPLKGVISSEIKKGFRGVQNNNYIENRLSGDMYRQMLNQ